MGQPIYMSKDEQKMTVYGHAQARIMLSRGWKFAAEGGGPPGIEADDLTAITGVGEIIANILANNGYTTYAKIANVPVDKLVALGISRYQAERAVTGAAKLLGEK